MQSVPDEYLGLIFPDRVEFVSHDWFPALSTLHNGGCTIGQRDLLHFCAKDPSRCKWLQLDERQSLGVGFVMLQLDKVRPTRGCF